MRPRNVNGGSSKKPSSNAFTNRKEMKWIHEMERKDIFTILFENYNSEQEMNKIRRLFFSPLFSAIYDFQPSVLTLEDIFERHIFFRWKQRGYCLNCAEMRQKLNIKRPEELHPAFKPTFDETIISLEYFSNIIYLVWDKLDLKKMFSCSNNLNFLTENIELLLNNLHYEKHIFKKEEKVILAPKNPAATSVAEISSENTSFAILMYNHASLKGKLSRKKELLRQISQEYEPLLKKGVDGFSDYFTKARYFLNNLDIRHNNMNNSTFKDLSSTDLEKLYDDLYQLLLFCVLIRDNKNRKDEMASFLNPLNK